MTRLELIVFVLSFSLAVCCSFYLGYTCGSVEIVEELVIDCEGAIDV